MTIFSETMAKAVSDYRTLLRRYLPQAERMVKLQELKLRDEEIYKNDLMLYKTGNAIVSDIEENMKTQKTGYYSYSGIQEFCNYLKEYLSNYDIENEKVTHRAQRASRALIQSIQLTSLSRENLNDSVEKQLVECNKIITSTGSDEQCDLQLQILTRHQPKHPGFYTTIIAHLESLIASRCSEAA